MIKTFLGTTALSLCLLAGAATAQVSDAQWTEVRDFLVRNPDVMGQVERLMDREISKNQVELDAAFIAENSASLFASEYSPVLGNAEGDVVVVKFTDYRCPHCRNVTPELEKLMDSDPRVKVIVKEFPILGPDSVDMARFAVAAHILGGEEAYEKAQAMLFDTKDKMSLALIKLMAEHIGLDEELMLKTMTSEEVESELLETQRLAAGLKINGTPGMIIKDFVVRGGIPYETMVTGVTELYAD